MRKFRGIIESPNPPSTDMIWIYNHEARYFSGGKWLMINEPVSAELTEPITSQLLPCIILEVGDSDAIKASNIEKLKSQSLSESNTNTFFVNIDYGYGVCTWDSNTGGHAYVITAYGVTIYYSITEEGEVFNGLETPDIYLGYINKGGTKTPEEFVQELYDLIG